MINYRIGGHATGKTFRLLRQLSGKEYVFIQPFKHNVIHTKHFIKESQKHGFYGDTSKAKVTTIIDYMMGEYNDINVIVIEDFNDFISSILEIKKFILISITKKKELNLLTLKKKGKSNYESKNH